MTIGAWVLCILVAFLIIAGSTGIGLSSAIDELVGGIVGFIIGVILSAALIFGVHWYFQNTASGARALKTQKSNFSNGIERQIVIYDINGNIIEQYEGKFDMEYDNDRILFDDENGNRHVIFYTTGTVIINECGDAN